MIYTTLNKIRAYHPCDKGWQKLLKHLGKTASDDEPLSLETILDSNGLEDALWCFRAVDGHDREIRLYTVWCARQVQHLMTDHRSLNALDVAERYANNDATDEERTAAWDEARAAARAAADAAAAAFSAALNAAWAAAWAAADAAAGAGDAARAAAWAAADAADAAAAARAAVWDATWAAQEAEFRRVFCARSKLPQQSAVDL